MEAVQEGKLEGQPGVHVGLLDVEGTAIADLDGSIPQWVESRRARRQLVNGLGPATLVDADLGAGPGGRLAGSRSALGSDGDLAQQVGCLDQVLVCRIALPDLAMDDAGKTICAGRLEGHARLMARAGEEVLVEGQGVLQEPPPDRLEVGQVDQMLLADAHQHRLHGIHRAGRSSPRPRGAEASAALRAR